MSFETKLHQEAATLHLPASDSSCGSAVTEADLAGLPEPAQRYLRFMRVVGRPQDWSFRLAITGRFRIGTMRWQPIQAWQYSSRPATARLFYMRLPYAGLVPTYGRDTYVEGRGRMLIRPLDWFTVVDGQGPEYDTSELVTYLNDAVMFAPSFLMGPQTSWTPVDEGSFDVAFTDRGRTVRARVFVDERGAPRDFSTTDRYYADMRPKSLPVRARWTTPIEGWDTRAERPLLTRGQAVWHLAGGPLPYAEFQIVPGSLVFNVPPA